MKNNTTRSQKAPTPPSSFWFSLVSGGMWAAALISCIVQLGHILVFYKLSSLPQGIALHYGQITVYKNLLLIGTFAVWVLLSCFAVFSHKIPQSQKLVFFTSIYPIAIALLLEIVIPR